MADVKRGNPNAFRQLEIRLKELEKSQLKTGWLESAKYPETGTHVAYVATIQEYGYGPIPPRPFMRPTVSDNKTEWKQTINKIAKDILEGKTTSADAYRLFGEVVKSDIVKSIVAVDSPELSKITLGVRKYKKEGKKITGAVIGEIARLIDEGKLDTSGVSTKPLNDSGYMMATIESQVTSQ